MGIFDKKPVQEPVNEPVNENEYKFTAGNMDDFEKLTSDLLEDKQVYPAPVLTEEEVISATPPEKTVSKVMADSSAKATVLLLDSGLAFLLYTFFATDGESIDDFKANNIELHELESCFAEMYNDANIELPPWAKIAISVVSIYGIKGATAYQNKKLKKKLDEQAKELDELRKYKEDEQARKLAKLDELEKQEKQAA